jgi:lipoprotein-anchoring transpeptidase ErfK/SrfK
VKHRAQVRPRYGRIATLTASLLVTGVAVLGGAGVLPTASPEVAAAEDVAAAPEPSVEPSVSAPTSPAPPTTVERVPAHPLPAGSGTGRRAVFDQSEQRVWLVSGAGRVMSTYLVSGSVTDNLDPGTYAVFSRSEDAVGIDGSTMRWFVRFTRGPSGAAIGFHDLPVDGGQVVQTLGQLGTAQSHGCIRQRTSDAKRMWRFAPLGTTVVVTA